MSAEPQFLFCPTCARECLAEAPPCSDGHGELCPERACVECGTALIDAPLMFPVRTGRAARRAA